MTVYVVNSDKKNKHDLTSAMRFGEIRYVNHKYVYGDEIEDERMPDAFSRNMVHCADQFDPDEDYLLILGDHLQLVAFAAILATRYSYFRVLRWTALEQAYFPVRIEPLAGTETRGIMVNDEAHHDDRPATHTAACPARRRNPGY